MAKGILDEEGKFESAGLEPCDYSLCFAEYRGNGDRCAEVKVGDEDMIRGKS